MKLARLQVLCDSEIQQIHEATLSLLATCGLKILNPRMLAFLKDCGLTTRPAEETVFFSRSCACQVGTPRRGVRTEPNTDVSASRFMKPSFRSPAPTAQ